MLESSYGVFILLWTICNLIMCKGLDLNQNFLYSGRPRPTDEDWLWAAHSPWYDEKCNYLEGDFRPTLLVHSFHDWAQFGPPNCSLKMHHVWPLSCLECWIDQLFSFPQPSIFKPQLPIHYSVLPLDWTTKQGFNSDSGGNSVTSKSGQIDLSPMRLGRVGPSSALEPPKPKK